MNHRFTPVWDNSGITGDPGSIQRAFYDSLSYFEKFYRCSITRKPGLPFPLDIAAAYQGAVRKLKSIDADLALFITVDDKGQPRLCSAEPYDIGSHTLYYIPVRPLYRLMKDRRSKKQAALLSSVFSYLYHILQIPYYRKEDTYLFDCYMRIEEWLTGNECEDDPETIHRSQTLLKQCADQGDAVLKRISDPSHLQLFESRLQQFTPHSDRDRQLRAIAEQVFSVMQIYPGKSLMQDIPECLFCPEESDRIEAVHYLSFFWDGNIEPINQTLIEYVSGCLENCGAMDHPAAFRLFNTEDLPADHETGFLTAVFEMIKNLLDFLTE